MPIDIEPQLATAAKQVPAHGDWSWEIKFDGYRMMTRIERGDIRLITRGGHDWTDRLPKLRNTLAALEVEDAWLDGEAIVFNAAGRPDFNSLQSAFDKRSTADILLFVFDLLWLNGVDMRVLPLRERRAKLQALLHEVDSPLVRFSADFNEDPQSLLASASKMQLEGIMGKRGDAPYRSGRTTDWIKLKANKQQEFVIGGFTRAKGATAGVDSLLLGVYELNGSLRYAGSVQPFLKARATAAFAKKALPLGQPTSPFANPPRREREREYHWLRPEMVCEVEYLEWTKSGEIRHPIFRALREDKAAREVTIEPVVDIDGDDARPVDESATAHLAARGGASVRGIKISNGDRIVDASKGHTKLEVVRYYEAIAEWALPHLHDRPLSLVRAPDGIAGEQFFQKHSESFRIPGVDELPQDLHPGHARLMVANNPKALVGLAQMGVLELHTWNAVAPDLTHPDRVIFDLDPDPSLPWSAMLEAAMLLKVVLDELGLTSFPKTSGGKGLHVVVPLTRKQGWDEVKAFSKAVAQHMASVVPSRFSAVSGPKNRVGKIFIDYLRNGKGASTVAAFSVRARPGMGVSMPVTWDELKSVKRGDQWNMQSAVARQVRLGGSVWTGYEQTRQGITAAMRRAVGMNR
jgi:bifunctional non-homologous end joining protein LigD